MINLPAPKVVQFKRAFTLKVYDEVDLLVLEHPDRTQNDPGFDALYKWFSKQPDPWRWNTLFNMLPWPGITPFHVVEDFATNWYGLVGEKDLGRKVCSVDRNPVTADRYATESFQKIFPTRQFRLTEDLNEGLSWMLEGYDLSGYDQGHDVAVP
jgi:hypothetical protein